MTTLHLGTLSMPAAELGSESPLPPLRPYGNASSLAAFSRQAGPDYPDRGNENIILPYRMQDGYNRILRPRDFKIAVLENEFIRATFLLEMGGRLWSLFDKSDNRELLYNNPVFQPANLAIRSAWFTGGVEWNVGMFGHSVLTCEPVFAATVHGNEGRPVLRLYEWERTRQIPFQIDFHLPEKSRFLYCYMRLANPHDQVLPMYWWSNIAIPEKEGTRVLAPAAWAYRHNYTGDLVTTDLPTVEGVDATYTTEVSHAADLYFSIEPGQRPWITSIDADGRGLVQTSTDRLIGRKLFNWGTATGGKRWQEFLSTPGERYLEIQGGLAKTQTEYVYMPPDSVWDWVEAYGPFSLDPVRAHREWTPSWRAADQRLEHLLPRKNVDAFLLVARKTALVAPDELLSHGSGWGALEQSRRKNVAETPMASDALPFPQTSMTSQQEPWAALLNDGEFPSTDAQADPGSIIVQSQWHTLLENSLANGRSNYWASWYHLGVMRYRRGDRAGAKAAWQQSIELTPSAWAYRNLAEADIAERNLCAAAASLEKAVAFAPGVVPLIRECCEMLLEIQEPKRVIAVLKAIAPVVRNNGRIRMLAMRAALAQGDPEPARQFYADGVTVDDIREGEVSVTDTWYQWQALNRSIELSVANTEELREQVVQELLVPVAYDFRMLAEPALCK